MQMFGIGLPELMVILFLSILVIGPDRLPAFAADLARWIRRARAYGNHLMRDFNDVMGDIEKEAGASREDWKEIAGVITRHTGDVTRDLQRTADAIERSGDLEAAKRDQPPVAQPPPIEPAANGHEGATEEVEIKNGDSPPQPEPDQPWYVPQRSTRRRNDET